LARFESGKIADMHEACLKREHQPKHGSHTRFPFSKVPICDIQANPIRWLFDHLVGATNQRRRQIEAKRFRSLHIDDQLEYRAEIPYPTNVSGGPWGTPVFDEVVVSVALYTMSTQYSVIVCPEKQAHPISATNIWYCFLASSPNQVHYVPV
jgi:hypothetical protein